ncbi:MAG TPA: DNA polymerase [Mycobacteriales bacterium]
MLADLPPGTVVTRVEAPCGVGVAWPGGSGVVERSASWRADLRWAWWAPGVPGVPASWDLAAVAGLVHGLRRADPAAVWAAAHGLPVPAPQRGEPSLFDLGSGEPVTGDGQLDASWASGGWTESPASVRRWAELALDVQQRQAEALGRLGRRALLTAHAESAVSLLCLEMARGGLPFDAGVAAGLLTRMLGPRPEDAAHEAAQRRERDDRVLATLPPGTAVDLRSPEQVRAVLARLGIDVPDTRSWRLEPHASASPTVAALLAWRKADRVATTYGWRWLDGAVSGGRLRGAWAVADGGAGRMTAGAGLHNMPAELRPAVRADPGHVLVGADLGQVEPRVLAVVSGDRALARAAAADDMYAPVAAQLGVDRPTAKVAVLAAMYGQTSGAAGTALRDMDRVYGTAMAYLRAAEQVGRDGGELRTYGGRLLRFGAITDVPGRGRYARNAMVQGAAAELFKAWAATVRAGLAGTGGQIVLCLHDELLLHVPVAAAAAAQALLRDALEQTVSWWGGGTGVRFVAAVRAGASWTDVH